MNDKLPCTSRRAAAAQPRRWLTVDASTLRPLVSGLVGATVSVLLTRRWANTLPTMFASKSIEQILAENKTAVSVANAMFVAGLFIGVAMYRFAGYSSKDWTPIAIGLGFSCAMTIVALTAIAKISRRKVKEAFVAFSIGQGTPIWATYGSLTLLSFLAIAALIKIAT